LDFTRPGEPTENGIVEALNSKLRDQILDVSQLLSSDDARSKTEAWRVERNLH